MWDPRSYRDVDYGLPPEEQFEPDLDDEPEMDLSQPHVMTVLGPIDPEELGICLPFEHVLHAPRGADPGGRPGLLDRLDLTAAELEHFTSLGGRSIVDITGALDGGTPKGLVALTQRVPGHVIVASGVSGGDRHDADAIRDEILLEFRNGFGRSTIRAGVLTIPTNLSPAATEGALAAAAEIGCAIYVDQPTLSELEELAGKASDNGIDADRIVVIGWRAKANGASVVNVLKMGATVGVSLVERLEEPQLVLDDVMHAISLGLENRVLISLGAHSSRHLMAYGGEPGWAYLLEHWIIEAMHRGATAQHIRRLLVENPATVLAKAHHA